MGVSLAKGGTVSLDKTDPGMKRVLIGLGWDVRATDGAAFDLDASAFLIGESGKALSDGHFIFYNNLKSADGSVEHTGDNLTGEGEGDDEVIKVDLGRLPADIQKIAVAVTIHDAEARRQNFGSVQGAFMRIVNADTNNEVARYDLTEDYSVETALIFGELYRHAGEFKFRAVGQGFAGGLAPLARNFGINIG